MLPPFWRNTDCTSSSSLIVDGAQRRARPARIMTISGSVLASTAACAAFIQLLADGDVVQLGALDDFLGALVGCLAGQRLLYIRVVWRPAHPAFRPGSRPAAPAPEVCKPERSRTARCSSVGSAESWIAANALIAGLLLLVSCAHDVASIARQIAAESTQVVQIQLAACKSASAHRRPWRSAPTDRRTPACAADRSSRTACRLFSSAAFVGHQVLVLQAGFDSR